MFVFGKKVGMTRFFLPSGESVGVTAVFLFSNIICDKVFGKDFVYKVSCGHVYKGKVIKPRKGELKFLSFFGSCLHESFFVNDFNVKVGEKVNVYFFLKIGGCVNVRSCSKGHGFSGVIKRHNFKRQPTSHGNSLSHRAPGSIGQRQFPGKVFKGKKMAGHYGNNFVTVRNAKIMYIDEKYNFMLLKGGIPGCVNTFVKIKKGY